MAIYARLFVSILTLTILFIGCAQKNSPEKGNKEQVFNVGNLTEPADLDPQITTGVPEANIYQAIFEGLVLPDPQNLAPTPGVARSWDISNDGQTYTFHLRKNARWSNGDQVTASDFVFSFKRILSPALAGEYAYMLFCLTNAEKYNKKEITDFSEVGAKSVDDTTLVLNLNKKVPYLLSLLAHHSWFPVHQATILKFGSIDSRGTPWTRPGNLVGNGPYTLKDWQINKVITVTKNHFYWDSATAKISTINFYAIDNNQTEERAFRTGQLHITTTCPLTKIDWYRKNDPKLLRIDPYLASYFYLLNVNRKPFDNIKVRKALALSINRKELTEYVLKGGQMPSNCFTPPGAGGYTMDSVIGFDTIQARKLLSEAGYTDPSKFPKVSLLYNTSESHQTVAQAIQQMWKRYLGIDVSLVNQEWKVYLANTHARDYDIARMGWTGDYNDPNTFLDLLVSGGGNNRTGWSNSKYDSLINAASQTGDQNERFRIFREAEHILLDELPILPIYIYTNTYLIQPTVKNWTSNLLNIHPYKYISLEQ
jgi:oligopeptide transport system substrate-binding protein